MSCNSCTSNDVKIWIVPVVLALNKKYNIEPSIQKHELLLCNSCSGHIKQNFPIVGRDEWDIIDEIEQSCLPQPRGVPIDFWIDYFVKHKNELEPYCKEERVRE